MDFRGVQPLYIYEAVLLCDRFYMIYVVCFIRSMVKVTTAAKLLCASSAPVGYYLNLQERLNKLKRRDKFTRCFQTPLWAYCSERCYINAQPQYSTILLLRSSSFAESIVLWEKFRGSCREEMYGWE